MRRWIMYITGILMYITGILMYIAGIRMYSNWWSAIKYHAQDRKEQ